MSEMREFENPFKDFSEPNSVIDKNTGQLKIEIYNRILENVNSLLHVLETNLMTSIDWSDYTVYTGTSGIALLYYHLELSLPNTDNQQLLSKSLSYIEKILPHLKRKKYSFLCGDSGPLAIAAVLYHKIAKTNDAIKLVNHLHSMVTKVCDLSTDLPDEVIYGRSGFMFALLFVRKYINDSREIITDNDIRNVIEAILKSGQRTAQREKHQSPPLMYYWHNKAYVGAAHGICGIMTVLLYVKQFLTSDELNELIKPTIDFILSLRFKSGNYPSSLGNSSDRLIHWCHGAPGAVHLFALAYETFGDAKYLNAANECCDVIWRRGILLKGYGICHGTSGNAYAFLRLYKITNEEKFLYRSVKFAEWCFDYGKHGCGTPDRPFSLFEGLAGTIYFLSDLLNPKIAQFPAF